MNPIRALLVGLGEHGCAAARLAFDAGVDLVAAVDPRHAGSSLAELLERPDLPAVRVVSALSSLEPVLKTVDIALVAARVSPDQFVDLALTCAEHGIDVLTITEEVFNPGEMDPQQAETLHRAALRHATTIVATGVQDVCWVGLVTHATAASRNLRSILLRQHHGVDGYPREFLAELGIGTTPGGFRQAVAGLAAAPSVLGSTLPVIARQLGHAPGPIGREFSPVTATTALHSKTMDRTLEPGDIIGVREVTTLTCDGGLALTADHTTTARPPGEDDRFETVLDAEPRITLSHEIVPGPGAVDATVVNRIPDVLEAPAGLVQSADLPTPRYRRELRQGSAAAARA